MKRIILCDFVVFTTWRFMLSLAVLFVLVFFSHFSIVITLFGEGKAGISASDPFVGLVCMH